MEGKSVAQGDHLTQGLEGTSLPQGMYHYLLKQLRTQSAPALLRAHLCQSFTSGIAPLRIFLLWSPPRSELPAAEQLLWLQEAAHNQKDCFVSMGRQGCMIVETTSKILDPRPPLGGKTSTVGTTVFLTVVSEGGTVDTP